MGKPRIMFRLPEDHLEAVDDYADRHNVDRSKAAREMLASGLRTNGVLTEPEPVADGGSDQTPLSRGSHFIGVASVIAAGGALIAGVAAGYLRPGMLAGSLLLVLAATGLLTSYAEPRLTDYARNAVDRLGNEGETA